MTPTADLESHPQFRAFQAALDSDPSDHAMRLVFADFLEEHGDWRAAGYRWMGGNGKCPMAWPEGGFIAGENVYPPRVADEWTWGASAANLVSAGDGTRANVLSAAERAAVGRRLLLLMVPRGADSDWADFRTRRFAEEALCLAVHEEGGAK